MSPVLEILRDATAPRAVKIFFWYAIAWCMLSIILAGGVLICWIGDQAETGAVAYAFAFAALALGVHGVALFSIRRSWGWGYDLVVVALGIGSCFFFLCLPLLLYWVKPNVRRYMRRYLLS